jgi:hypothetical protein
MGVPTDRVLNVGTFTEGQKQFLDYHRDAVLLRAVHWVWGAPNFASHVDFLLARKK